MRTEDHPLEYGSFEGVIPEGYGSGIVMLWDYGTWTPQLDDPDVTLAKGDLKFTLDGYKLKGSWALVRTGGSRRPGSKPDDRSWLLIKHRDEWSGPLDITTFAPHSVKSEGDFEHILAADVPAVWVTDRPAKSGATGALLAEVIERAARLKQAPAAPGKPQARRPASAKRRTSRRAVTGPSFLRPYVPHPRLRRGHLMTLFTWDARVTSRTCRRRCRGSSTWPTMHESAPNATGSPTIDPARHSSHCTASKARARPTTCVDWPTRRFKAASTSCD